MRRAAVAQVSIKGAASRSPNASPDHQESQSVAKRSDAPAPLAARDATPTVELTVVLTIAASPARARTSRTRSSAGRNPATCASSQVPATASSVFPAAIAAAPATGTPLVAFARNAPRATAGQKRTPRRTRAASAIPEGGHAEETTPCAAAAKKPSLADAKYNAASSATTVAYGTRP